MIAARELLDMLIGQIRTLRAFLSEQLDEGEGSESETAETRTCNEILAYLSVLLQRLEATGPHIAGDQGFWLFREFKDARPGEMPSLLSDHPNDQKRIDALTQHFAANPAVFSRFSQDPSSADAFAAERTLRLCSCAEGAAYDVPHRAAKGAPQAAMKSGSSMAR